MLTWKEVDGAKPVKSRLRTKGYRDLDLRNGDVGILGCASRRSPHLQMILLGALEEWPLCSLDIKNAFSQADDFDREAYLRA